MKEILNLAGRRLRVQGASTVAGALAATAHSVRPALAVLLVLLGQQLCEAITPALQELLLRLAREVGSAAAEELAAMIRRSGRRRRRGCGRKRRHRVRDRDPGG